LGYFVRINNTEGFARGLSLPLKSLVDCFFNPSSYYAAELPFE